MRISPTRFALYFKLFTKPNFKVKVVSRFVDICICVVHMLHFVEWSPIDGGANNRQLSGSRWFNKYMSLKNHFIWKPSISTSLSQSRNQSVGLVLNLQWAKYVPSYTWPILYYQNRADYFHQWSLLLTTSTYAPSHSSVSHGDGTEKNDPNICLI